MRAVTRPRGLAERFDPFSCGPCTNNGQTRWPGPSPESGPSRPHTPYRSVRQSLANHEGQALRRARTVQIKIAGVGPESPLRSPSTRMPCAAA